MPHHTHKYLVDVDSCLKNIDKNKSIVFTNGCFDLLHDGHLHLLSQAKALGDILIVAINTDNSIKKIKGNSRPIESLDIRIQKLAQLECVDYIISFDENTPYELIKKIQPNILVKGGDYSISDIVGADLVDEVVIVPLLHGFSTTKIIEKMK